MRLLLDTHLLLWAVHEPERLPAGARNLMEDPENIVFFSTTAVWEVTIKNARDKPDFRINPRRFRDRLVANQFLELSITSDHALAVVALPQIHKDPFDRILVAQATHEGITLLTSDTLLVQYPGPIMLV